MSKLSGIRDVDREILSKLDDKSLLKACSFDKYTWNTVCDDAFLRRRLLAKYPKIEQYKFENETWKHFFLRAVRYIALMKEKYGYEYALGDFVKQYSLNKDNGDRILIIFRDGIENDDGTYLSDDFNIQGKTMREVVDAHLVFRGQHAQKIHLPAGNYNFNPLIYTVKNGFRHDIDPEKNFGSEVIKIQGGNIQEKQKQNKFVMIAYYEPIQ